MGNKHSRGLKKHGANKGSNQSKGQTMIMYHGTTLTNALKITRYGFMPSSGGMLGRGIYVTRSFQKACAYPKDLPSGEEAVVLKLRVHVGKVKKIDHQGHPLQKTWHKKGYDTAWVPPNCGMVPSGLEENCVWDPDRIKVLEILNRDGNTKDLSPPQQPPTPPVFSTLPFTSSWVEPNSEMASSGLENDCVWDPEQINELEILSRYGSSIDLFSFGLPYCSSAPTLFPGSTPLPPSFGVPCPTPIPPPCVYPYPAPIPPPIGYPFPTPVPPPLGYFCPPAMHTPFDVPAPLGAPFWF